ncbi:MAG: hypothetical protein SGI72_09195 [Planctomycetota bacterium]|nr:hypothetical protein [Planctomycetota bacterium]
MKFVTQLGALALLFFTASARAQNVIFSDDFESGYGNWTMGGL